MRQKREMLVVYSCAFANGHTGATPRILQLLEAWRELGWSAGLLSDRLGSAQRWYELIDPKVERGVSRLPVTEPPPSSGLPVRLRRLLPPWSRPRPAGTPRKSPVYRKTVKWGEFIEASLPFGDRALRARLGAPEFLWCICADRLDSLVAGRALSRLHGVPWVAVMHDPPMGTVEPDVDQDVLELYRTLLADCAFAVTTTESYRRRLLGHYGLPESKVACLYMRVPTVEPDEAGGGGQPAPGREGLSLVHAGRLYLGEGKRTLLPLLTAMAELRAEGLTAPIFLDVAGPGPGIEETEAFVRAHGLGEHVRIHGVLPREAARRLITQADLSLILQGSQQREQLPNKTFELFALGRPILGLVPEASEVREILSNCGLAVLADPDRVPEIKAVLRELAAARAAGTLDGRFRRNDAYLENFSLQRLPRDLGAIVDKVLASRPAARSRARA